MVGHIYTTVNEVLGLNRVAHQLNSGNAIITYIYSTYIYRQRRIRDASDLLVFRSVCLLHSFPH